MWQVEEKQDRAWVHTRVKRHFSELVRLSGPAAMARVGVFSLGMVDTAMVGHYATSHLAWLNLANQSIIMFTLVIGIGFLLGALVYVAEAFGRGDPLECGRVWRRSLPMTFAMGLVIILTCLPAESLLLMTGQTPEKAEMAGDLILILSLGLPAHMLFFIGSMFLDGIKRPSISFFLMIGANVINVSLNYALIFGHFGMPEMGAEGSAWASTAIRWFIAISITGYILFAPSTQKYGARLPHGQRWADWAGQRKMGYASATALAAEVAAFSGLVIFAGWLGTEPLAAYGIINQISGVPLMASIGIGIATAVRVGIAYGRRDRFDTALAGWMGLVVGSIVMTITSILLVAFGEEFTSVFSSDESVIIIIIPLLVVIAISMVFDAFQMIMSNVLRGLKESWWPTGIQSFVYLGTMIPICYYLAFTVEMGLLGLIWGTLIASFLSFALLTLRFMWLVRPHS